MGTLTSLGSVGRKKVLGGVTSRSFEFVVVVDLSGDEIDDKPIWFLSVSVSANRIPLSRSVSLGKIISTELAVIPRKTRPVMPENASGPYVLFRLG